MAQEFVDPTKIERLALSGENRWIEVKRELNAGEQRRVFTRMMRDMTPGEKVALIPEQVGLTKVVEYLIGWSFTDSHGNAVPISESALNNLKPSTFLEIVKAVDEHEARYDDKRAEEKNDQAGVSGLKPISPSPDAAIGAMSGSTNLTQTSTTS